MPSLKARVVTATGTRVRNVHVDVKPVIKKLAATPPRPTPQKVTAPKPATVAGPSGPPPMRPTRPPTNEQRSKRRSTNPRPTRTRKTR